MKTNQLISSLFLFISLFLIIEAVDRGKFKKCDQSSFCVRNRGIAHSGYKLSSFRRNSDSTVVADLTSPYLNGRTLSFQLTGLKDNTVRMRVIEDLPNRYNGPQEILEPLQESNLVQTHNDANNFEFHLGKVKVKGTYSPIRLDFYLNGELSMSVNGQDFFNFEHLRTKEEDELLVPKEILDMDAKKPEDWNEAESGEWKVPMKSNPARDNRWEENFGGHPDSKPYGPTSLSLDVAFVNAKHVYGIPEHAANLALPPTVSKGAENNREIKSDPYRLYNLDVFEYELHNPMALYGSVPFMLSHGPKSTAGFFWMNAAETWIDVEETKQVNGKDVVETQWISESGQMDVFFLLGPSPYDVFRQYAALTGTTALPPIFSLGYHQCKWNYKDEKDVSEVDAGFESHNIPYDVIWLDIEHTDSKKYFTWDQHFFPTPLDMQEKIASRRRQMVTIVDPHIKRDGGYHVHQQAQAHKHYIVNKDGNEYEGHCWPGGSSWVDYLNQKARDWWERLFSYDQYVGSSPNLYTWNDMNEPSVFNGPEVTMHKDAKHLDGTVEHRDVHNYYGMTMVNATSRGLLKRNKGENKRPFVLSRAFFAGIQKHGAIWTGDNTAGWDHLAIAQPMLLSLGLTGVTFSGADVGGFFGNPDGELVTRWYQAAAFQPFFRGHAHIDSKRREPWLFGEPYTSAIRSAIKARYTFLPLWYTLFYQNTLNGAPVIRPLWVEFPQDDSTFAEQDEYLVGRHLLVRPVTQQSAKEGSVYFPGKDAWFDVTTHKRYEGSTSATLDAPLDRFLVFQRGGSIVPKKERVRRSTTQTLNDPYTLVVAVDSQGKASGELYVDDGQSFNFRNGEFVYRSFEFDGKKLSSKSLKDSSASFENTIERVVFYGLNKTPKSITLDSNSSPLSFSVQGERLIVRKPNLSVSKDFSFTLNF